MPTFIQSLAVKVSVAKARMPCGELTGRMNPKLTTNWSSIVMSMMLRPWMFRLFRTAIMMGIMAEATAVALAKPRWTMMRKSARMAKTAKTPMEASPRLATSCVASHMAAFVLSRAEPRLMPMPKRTKVPQETRDWASFQVMMLIPGRNMSVMAMTVDAVVETGCRTFSVTQAKRSRTEMASSFFSAAVMGPRSAMDCLTVSSPPATSSISAGSIFMQMK